MRDGLSSPPFINTSAEAGALPDTGSPPSARNRVRNEPKRGHFLLRLTDLDRHHPRLGFLPGLERDWANLSYERVAAFHLHWASSTR
jgi:hypothetical protein